MEKWKIILALVVILVAACKKREEFPKEQLPNGNNMRIVEITDTNLVTNAPYRHQTFSYDQLGRIMRWEVTLNNFITTYSYSYGTDWLSRIIINYSDGSVGDTVSFYRDGKGRITEFFEDNSFFTGRRVFGYTEEGNLRYTASSYFADDSIQNGTPKDTTFYFDHVNGRYTRAVNVPVLEWGIGGATDTDTTFRLTERRTYNPQGLLETLTSIAGSQISREEDTYYPIKDSERALFQNNRTEIMQYYSPNLDVYEFMRTYIPTPLNYFVKEVLGRSTTYAYVYKHKTVAILRTDFHELPSQMIIVDSSGLNNAPNVLKLRTTYRYEATE